MRPPQWVRDFYYRISSASKVEFFLDLLNVVCTGYSVYFGYLFVQIRFDPSISIPDLKWDLFWASSLYILLHKHTSHLILKKQRKWERAHSKRHRELSTAVLRLAACLQQHGRCDPAEITEIENGLLSAMLSNVEEAVLDKEGIYLNVTLLMEHPTNQEIICSVNRANKDRPCREYPKSGILAWGSIQTGRCQYEPNYQSVPSDPKPYKSIFAIPITSIGSDSPPYAAISIDSEKAHHFDGRIPDIELRLAPSIALLRLTLHYRTTGGTYA